MAKHTYEERLVAGLLSLGWTEDKTDRSKYRAFVHADTKVKRFVGRAGALRQGECASRSFSIGCPGDNLFTHKAYFQILEMGDKALNQQNKPDTTEYV